VRFAVKLNKPSKNPSESKPIQVNPSGSRHFQTFFYAETNPMQTIMIMIRIKIMSKRQAGVELDIGPLAINMNGL
jgi:hypothetical protein